MKYRKNIFFAAVICGILLSAWHFVKSLKHQEYTKDGRLIVRYWEKWTGIESNAMQSVVDDFNSSQKKLFVKMEIVSKIDQKLLMATVGGNPPDVCGLWTKYLLPFAEKGALIPLNNLCAKAGIKKEDYLPVIWEQLVTHGYIWALPTTPYDFVLFWNPMMFKKAGLDPDKPPKTIDELEKYSDLLTIVRINRNGQLRSVKYTDLTPAEKEKGDFEIEQLGFAPNIAGGWYVFWSGYWFGGGVWNGKDKVTANDKANIDAVKWYAHFAKKYGLKNLRGFGLQNDPRADSPENPFIREKVAMYFHGSWLSWIISYANPSLNWKVCAFPSAISGLENVSIVDTDCLVIPVGSRHPKEAFEFIRFVNSQQEIEKLNTAHKKFSPLSKISDQFIKFNPRIDAFYQIARNPNAHTIPMIPISNEYDTEYTVNAIDVYDGNITAEKAMNIVQERAQRAFDRFLERWKIIEKDRYEMWREENDRF